MPQPMSLPTRCGKTWLGDQKAAPTAMPRTGMKIGQADDTRDAGKRAVARN